jgi:hypothetical protein
MTFRFIYRLVITLIILTKSLLAADINESSTQIIHINSVHNDTANTNNDARCTSYEWWCDIRYGISMAESSGTNGIMINGYAYHLSIPAHWPTAYSDDGNVNELAPGLGYTRSYYNPKYNSEYILFAMAFADSFYKPEVHVGYIYQKYFNLTNSGNFKWGIGYSPFIFVKPTYTANAPIPIPGAGITTSIRYGKASIILTYAINLLLNMKIDF